MEVVLYLRFFLVSTFFLIWFARFFQYSKNHVANVLYWDQWDFYQPLFSQLPVSDHFFWQHGPHRQGLGGVFLKFFSEWTSWSQFSLVYFLLALLFFAGVVALRYKKFLTGRWHFSDLLIPLFFFSMLLLGTFIGPVNPAHGVFPLILLMLVFPILAIDQIALRYACLLTVNFLLVFTGFGLFAGFAVPLLILSEILLSGYWNKAGILVVQIKRHGLPMLISVATLLFFFWRYERRSASTCFVFPDPEPLKYFQFVFLQLSALFGYFNKRFAGQIVGAIIFILIAREVVSVILNPAAFKTRKEMHWWRVTFFVSAFSALFMFGTAVGRACFGLHAALFSRYFIYLLPLFFFFYLSLIRSNKFRAKIGLLLLLIFGFTRESAVYKNFENDRLFAAANDRKNWIPCYLERRNAAICDRLSQTELYPHTSEILGRLKYLEERKLMLFEQ